MITDEIVDLSRAATAKHGLSLPLVLGVIETESSGDTWAYNPEPKWQYLWDCLRRQPFRAVTKDELRSELPPPDFPAPARGVDADAEWWAQQASWGLMQVMGAVAREMGYGGPFLTALCDPEIGLNVGCAKLARLLRTWGNPEMAVCAYNRGHVGYVPGTREFLNQAYVSKVTSAATAWLNRGVA